MTAALNEPHRHEPLIDADWDERVARAALERIVADTESSFDPTGLWPLHPLDRSPERADSLKTLYYGAAGVIWTLNYFAETGAVRLQRDYLPAVRELAARHRDDLRRFEGVRRYLGNELGSYMLGETGIFLLHWKLAPSAELARQVYAAIESKIGDPRGLAWGAAGAMLAALFMHQRTGEPRWEELYLRAFDALWNQWQYVDELRCYLWTQDLYGVSEWRLGALHGFVSNVFAMVRGRHLLPPERADELLKRIHDTLHATASSDEAYVNWPNNIDPSTREAPLPMFVQVCNGAPGVVIGLCDLPPDSRWPLDPLLHRACELIWKAGPLTKLPSLCHATPGNGYAFLKWYARTGDPMSLNRARRFAMHAIAQRDRALLTHGQRKYSLWTGDLGLAVFLWDCLRGSANFPTLDFF